MKTSPVLIADDHKLFVGRFAGLCGTGTVKESPFVQACTGAPIVNVMLRSESDMLELTVGDQGCGFDASSSRGGDSLGLVSMKERARLIHAAFKVESVPGRGTTVRVALKREANG